MFNGLNGQEEFQCTLYSRTYDAARGTCSVRCTAVHIMQREGHVVADTPRISIFIKLLVRKYTPDFNHR